jgi:hypothetical protein
MTDTPDLSKPHCYVILETEFDPGKGYVPSLVVQDDPGHYPMRGSGPFASPWYWGLTLDAARAACAAANAERGITPEMAQDIVDSSMIASFRQSS